MAASENSSVIISDGNDADLNSQEENLSYEEISKLGETSTQDLKEHENSEKITINILQAEILICKNFVMGEISDINGKILGIFLNSGKQKETKELEHLKKENENKTLTMKSLFKRIYRNLLVLFEKIRANKMI